MTVAHFQYCAEALRWSQMEKALRVSWVDLNDIAACNAVLARAGFTDVTDRDRTFAIKTARIWRERIAPKISKGVAA